MRNEGEPMPRKWITVNIPADMHDHIAELIEHPMIKKKYAFGNPSEFVRRALADKIAQIEREIKEDNSSKF